MKLTIILLMSIILIISGCAGTTGPTTEQPKDEVADITEGTEGTEGVDETVVDEVIDETDVRENVSSKLLIDKNKYITGGSDFDTARQLFTQEADKGFKIVIETNNKQAEFMVMTQEDCLFRDKGKEFKTLSTGKGIRFDFEGSETFDKKREICIFMKALENGEIINHIIVEELSY